MKTQNNFAHFSRGGKLSTPYLKFTKVDAETAKKAFTPQELKQIMDMFVYFDKTGNNTIKRDDLGFALRAIGYLVTTIEIRELGMYLDPKKTQILNFEQFITACYNVRNRKPNKQEIINALKIFEKNKSGYIDVKEIKSIITKIGDVLNLTEFDIVISEITQQFNGFIKTDDLVNLLIMS
ncbi:unnamed protein product [Paramecium pentaurelia]|uniref:Calmodulin n=1 Tax=Paramecium pentaurelia TaxID=43138 RepID=A0A8S1ULJ0_9CILI|nr:unnamed protein product [Paramecium pentaurelia]